MASRASLLAHSPAAAVGSSPQRREGRIAGLDGLRGLAILLVIIHNTGNVRGAFDGIALKIWGVVSNSGWIGVQFFFALSGFLITRILLDGKGGEGALRSFYARRFLRIVPLYYVFLAFVFLIAPHVGSLAAVAGTGSRSAWWYWAYLSNWIGQLEGGAPAAPHLWSLAVEEQFYLAWPLIVAGLGPRALARLCITMFAAAIVFREALHLVFAPDVASSAAYYFTITRWDSIALGALVALAISHPRITAWLRQRLSIVFLAPIAVLALVFVLEHGLAFTGRTAELINQPVTGIISALIVFACADPGVSVGRWLQASIKRALSAGWLSFIGKYSYAVYVFHMPVHLVLRQFADPQLNAGGAGPRFLKLVAYTGTVFGLSLLLAILSWSLLESRMLALKRYFPMPRHSTA